MKIQPISSLYAVPVIQRVPGAPPFDPARPIQRFVLPAGTNTYRAFSNGVITDVPINPAHADKPNLPGMVEYPKWEPAPTPATKGSWTGQQPIDPGQLSTQEQAMALASALKDAGGVSVEITEDSFLPWFPISYNGDVRRLYNVKRKDGYGANVGRLLAVQYASGVGHPGVWRWDGPEPVWTPAKLSDGTGAPELPHPCRDLLPGERFVQQFGGIWVVETVDPAAPTLENIYAAILRVEAKLKG